MSPAAWAGLYAAIVLAFGAVRVFYQRQARGGGPRIAERRPVRVVDRLLAPLVALGLLGSVLYLAGAAPLDLPLPDAARALGAVLAIAGTAFLGWSHQALGRQWSTLVVRMEGHELVTWGPYRWVRHPMYTALLLWALGLLLLSANLAAGAPWLLLVALAATRAPAEERLMEDTFGEAYRAWAARTGRFLPRPRAGAPQG